MPRRSRAARPPARSVRPAASAPSASHVPARAAPAASTPMVAQPQQPSLMGQMAATAGGVAIGSVVGHAVTGLFSGDSSEPAAAAAAAPISPAAQQYTPSASQASGPCSWEMKQFMECAQNQSDFTLCDGFSEALRQCKVANHA